MGYIKLESFCISKWKIKIKKQPKGGRKVKENDWEQNNTEVHCICVWI
jgi:hypothetical protein